jgi:hypothetical protein
LTRRVRTDQRRVEGVEARGGQPGSRAREERSLHVDRSLDVELPQRGDTTPTTRRIVATGGAARYSSMVILMINRRRKTFFHIEHIM